MSVDKEKEDEYDVSFSRPKSAPGASVVALRHSSRKRGVKRMHHSHTRV